MGCRQQSLPPRRGEGKRRSGRRRRDHGEAGRHAQASRGLEWALQGACRATARSRPRRRSEEGRAQGEPEAAKACEEERQRGGGSQGRVAFEKTQARRERERAKEEAVQRKQRERRQKHVDKAQNALDAARRSHDRDAAGIQAKIEDLEEQSRAEEARWGKERSKLEAALRRARK